MKKFLKFAGLFILGLVIGSVTTGYVANYKYRQLLGGYTLLAMANDIFLLELYRRDSADPFFKSIEDSIPEKVLMIENNSDMKSSGSSSLVLRNAKSFYICTETPVPKEIREIIDGIDLGKDFSCDPGP